MSAGEVTDGLREFLSRVQGMDIRCLEHTARMVDLTGLPPTHVSVSFPEEVEYGLDEASLVCRFRVRVEFKHEEALVAEAQAEYALANMLSPGEPPTEDVLRAYLHDNARFIVYPYLREAVQSSVAKIGMGNLVLGLMRRDQVTDLSIEFDLGVAPDDGPAILPED